jgi:hypothetical protein
MLFAETLQERPGREHKALQTAIAGLSTPTITELALSLNFHSVSFTGADMLRFQKRIIKKTPAGSAGVNYGILPPNKNIIMVILVLMIKNTGIACIAIPIIASVFMI